MDSSFLTDACSMQTSHSGHLQVEIKGIGKSDITLTSCLGHGNGPFTLFDYVCWAWLKLRPGQADRLFVPADWQVIRFCPARKFLVAKLIFRG